VTDLGRRTLTALVYGAVVLVAAFTPISVFAIFLLAVTALATAELVALRRAGVVVLLEALLLAGGIVSLFFLRVFGSSLLLITILAVWAADVAAYAFGSTFGRHKIAPRISPGKTWEGTLAGFLAAAGVVLLATAAVGTPDWAVVTAIAIGPAAFAGDLLESWLKRRAGVKDSGKLLPGHGGVLDRIDSLLAAAPLVALVFLQASGRG
jgi:phosphatidate cytidylyltransferase